jgi:hypothetical protein
MSLGDFVDCMITLDRFVPAERQLRGAQKPPSQFVCSLRLCTCAFPSLKVPSCQSAPLEKTQIVRDGEYQLGRVAIAFCGNALFSFAINAWISDLFKAISFDGILHS